MTPGRAGDPAGHAGEAGAGEGLRERFTAGLGFPMDGFQLRAMDAIARLARIADIH